MLSLVDWREAARSWVVEHAAELPEEVRPGPGVREPAVSADEPAVSVGILGLSSAGKSSLLNALLTPGLQLVPAGGVGPLTRVPIRLVHRRELRMRASYRSRRWLEDIQRELSLDRYEAVALGQLSILCTGDPYAAQNPAWLLRAVRYALQPSPAALPECDDAIRLSLNKLSRALESLGGKASCRHADGAGAFHRAVRDHAVGQLAPLCADLELGCDAELLAQGLELVDLPGLGTSGDVHAPIALEQLARLGAVVIAVDRSGISEVVMEALVRSGFLSRWMNGEADGVIAVTKLDLVADDARASMAVSRPWRGHLRAVMDEVRQVIRQQVRVAFARAGGPRAERLIAEPERIVCPVTSHEMEALHGRPGDGDGDGEARCRVKLAESTGIPELRRAIVAMARGQSARWTRAVTAALRAGHPSPARSRELYSEWLTLLDEVAA